MCARHGLQTVTSSNRKKETQTTREGQGPGTVAQLSLRSSAERGVPQKRGDASLLPGHCRNTATSLAKKKGLQCSDVSRPCVPTSMPGLLQPASSDSFWTSLQKLACPACRYAQHPFSLTREGRRQEPTAGARQDRRGAGARQGVPRAASAQQAAPEASRPQSTVSGPFLKTSLYLQKRSHDFSPSRPRPRLCHGDEGLEQLTDY